ncbi:hypothetical protein HSX11_16640 [Oxalobacteraceae bacterium]|nr:hypothetical protein [Oxalobacteraceae bacterium]
MPIYVQHEVLGRIPDVFNAEAIWQAPGLALFARRPLLRDLLERSPREHRGRAATRCFSHVTLLLPQEDVDDDYHLTRGNRARELAQTLTALHQKDFGDLLGSDQVRYDVAGVETLAPGQIGVRFGHAVYIPGPDEKILYNVSLSRDSAVWQTVCPIYPNQRLALLDGDGVPAGSWPFGPDGAILIVNDGPDAPPIVQMRPKDSFDCRFDPRGGHYIIRSARAGEGSEGGARLLLKIGRIRPSPADIARTGAGPRLRIDADKGPVAGSGSGSGSGMVAGPGAGTGTDAATHAAHPSPAPHAPVSVWQQRGASAIQADATAVPLSHQPERKASESDATFAPLARQRVSLAAIALPRLSRYRDTGADALELPFDQALTPCAEGAAAISFIVTAADELYACSAAGRQRIVAPARFTPVDARVIALLPAPDAMSDRYCALLCLPQAPGASVAAGARFAFGRNSPALAALRVLDSPRFLKHSGTADGASADRIGLSRKAFSFEAAAQGFHIARLAATQALYHLDDKLAFVASIGDSEADAPYFLPAGHHLVAGHYVLRFDA